MATFRERLAQRAQPEESTEPSRPMTYRERLAQRGAAPQPDPSPEAIRAELEGLQRRHSNLANPDIPRMEPAEEDDRSYLSSVVAVIPGMAAVVDVPTPRPELTVDQMVKDQAQRSGVGTQGPGIKAEAIASLAADANEQVVKSALSAAYGKELEFRTGPQTGRLEFKDPETGKFALVESPGFSMSDFGAAVGPAISIVGELIGGMAGAATGSPTGTVLFGALGATIGEYARLKAGQMYGINEDLSNTELAAMAGARAGLPSLLGGAAMEGVIRAGRALAGGRTGGIPGIHGQKSPEKILHYETALEEAREIERRLGVAFPGKKPFKFTGSQVATGTSMESDVFALEQSLKSIAGDTGDPLRRAHAAQRQASREYMDALGEMAGREADPSEIGGSLQKEVRKQIKKVQHRIEKVKEKPVQVARESIQESILDRAARADTEVLGARIKAVRNREQVEFQAVEASKYKEIDETVDQLGIRSKFPAQGLYETAKRITEEMKENLFSSLNEFDRRIVNDLIDQITVTNEAGVESIRNITWGEVSASLSALKRLKRTKGKGTTPDVPSRLINQLIEAIEGARAQTLSAHPELLAKVSEAENFVWESKQALDRSVLGDIVKVREGREMVLDGQAFGKIFIKDDGTPSAALASVLDRPIGTLTPAEQELYAGVRTKMRSQIAEKYRREVIGDDGFVSPSSHDRFLRDYGPSMKPWFSDKEMKEIELLDGLSRVAKRYERRVDELVKLAEKSHPLAREVASKRYPADVFRAIWKNGDVATTRRAWRIAKDDPELVEQLRGAVHLDMRLSIAARSPNGEELFDFRRLGKYLRDHRKQLEEVFEGTDYVKNMDLLHEAFMKAQRTPIDRVYVPSSAERTPVELLTRVVAAPPLTREGRAATAMFLMRRAAASRALGNLMADPPALSRAMRIRGGRRLSRENDAMAVLSGAGALILAEDLRGGFDESNVPLPNLDGIEPNLQEAPR